MMVRCTWCSEKRFNKRRIRNLKRILSYFFNSVSAVPRYTIIFDGNFFGFLLKCVNTSSMNKRSFSSGYSVVSAGFVVLYHCRRIESPISPNPFQTGNGCGFTTLTAGSPGLAATCCTSLGSLALLAVLRCRSRHTVRRRSHILLRTAGRIRYFPLLEQLRRHRRCLV